MGCRLLLHHGIIGYACNRKVRKVDNIYGRLKRILNQFDCDVGASEAHGILFGLITGPKTYEEELWLSCLADPESFSRESLDSDSLKFFTLLSKITLEVVREASGVFILLPQDNVQLSVRVSEFSQWCQGYLFGLGISGFSRDNISTEDGLSFLADIERFCRVDAALAENEEGEKALMELQEYTRVGIMIVYEELRTLRLKHVPKRDIH